MDTQKFLKDLLVSQELTAEQEQMLQEHKKEVTDFLRSEFGSDPVIKFAGSREKGTMNRDNYDLDIVCYFPSSDTRTLKEIREDTAAHLGSKYTLQHKASAERIVSLKEASTPQGYHIDVVPGRFIEGSKDVFLHVAYGEKERMQTNLKTHIEHIKNSGCIPVIRLVKIWAHRNRVNVKTFILELFIIKSLAGSRSKDDLQKSFLQVMEALKNDFEKTLLVDPANSGNVVSQIMESWEKIAVARAAQEVFNKLNTSEALSDWQAVFCEPITSVKIPVSAPFTPHKPWAM
jgi:hypothetical protein